MILFLDFDGVLHPIDRPHGPFSLLPHFERVMRGFPHVDIVISSAWREAYGIDRLRALFSADIAGRILGSTPWFESIEHEYVRETEIRSWLRHHRHDSERWLAIDDSALLFTPRCRNLILVDGEVGFDELTERELRKRLG